ncbi:MAG: hypothetical protein LR011_04090 [Verrucomicrobia bacterium]|nr:hypothetical protein [Verrucomicrobiota bacterium]
MWVLVFSANQKPDYGLLDDPEFYHTAAGAHYRVKELAAKLNQYMDSGDWQQIHNNMYYMDTLVDAFVKKCSPEMGAQISPVCRKIKALGEKIDSSSGKSDAQKTTGLMLELFKLIDELNKLFDPTGTTPEVLL